MLGHQSGFKDCSGRAIAVKNFNQYEWIFRQTIWLVKEILKFCKNNKKIRNLLSGLVNSLHM